MIRYCLECGYSRQGLPEDAVCPECGEADSFEKQREVCAALANKPLTFLWRVMTLRRMPKGWWVVFEEEHPSQFKHWQFFLAGLFVFLTFSSLGQFIHIESTTTTFMHDINDPLRSPIVDISIETEKFFLTTAVDSHKFNFQPGLVLLAQARQSNQSTVKLSKRRSTRLAFGRDSSEYGPKLSFIGFLLMHTIVVWILSRFVWLPLIAQDSSTLAFRYATRQTTVIYVAQVLWLIALSLVGFIAFLTDSLVSVITLEWIYAPYTVLQTLVIIFGSAVLWSRLISTDNLKLEFPRRLWAGLLLIGFTLLPMLALIIWIRFWLN